MSKNRYAKTDLNWIEDPRCEELMYPSYKWLNHVLWILCVREQTEVLPPRFTAPYLSKKSGIDSRTVRKALTFMSLQNDPLIAILDDKSIHVFGVADCHESANFKFKRIKDYLRRDVSEDVNDDVCDDVDESVNECILNKTKQNNTISEGEEATTEEAKEILKMFPAMKTVNTWLNRWSEKIHVSAILDQVRNAHEWSQNQTTSKKRKSSNPTGFLTNWLTRYLSNPQTSKMASHSTPELSYEEMRDASMTEDRKMGFWLDWVEECEEKGLDPHKEPYSIPMPKSLK